MEHVWNVEAQCNIQYRYAVTFRLGIIGILSQSVHAVDSWIPEEKIYHGTSSSQRAYGSGHNLIVNPNFGSIRSGPVGILT